MATPRFRYFPADAASGHAGARLIAGGCARIAPGEIYPIAGHPDTHRFRWDHGRQLQEFQLVLITAGNGLYEDRGGLRTLAAGDGFLLVPGRWHRYRPDPESGWEERWLAFSGREAVRLACEDRIAPGPIRQVDGTLRTWLDEALILLDHQPACWREQAEALLLAMLARLDGRGRARDDDPLAAAARHLEREPNHPVADLARQAGLSPSRFRELFRLRHGLSPRLFRLHVLAARAHRLLAVSGGSVGEVARALGFQDPAHFTRSFRRACGTSPSAWLQQHRLAQRPAAPGDRESGRPSPGWPSHLPQVG